MRKRRRQRFRHLRYLSIRQCVPGSLCFMRATSPSSARSPLAPRSSLRARSTSTERCAGVCWPAPTAMPRRISSAAGSQPDSSPSTATTACRTIFPLFSARTFTRGWKMAHSLLRHSTKETQRRQAMAQVIVVTSGKGGVGKTTTTAALGAALAQHSQRVVVVDFDVGLRNLDLVMGAERRVVYDLTYVAQGS